MTLDPRAFGFPIDLTGEYKACPSLSSHIKAIKSAGMLERKERIRLLYNQENENDAKDVHFWVKEIGWVLYGDDINVQVEFNNRAAIPKTIRFSVRVHVQMSTGRLASQINHFQEQITLKAYECKGL
jgi:hypothetical protein